MADSELSRTHPLTIVVRTVKSLIQMIFALIALVFFGAMGGGNGLLAAVGIAGIALLLGLVSAGFAWLNWAYFRFGVVDHDLIVVEGWLVKKRRAIPLARVQGIDIRADLTSRLLGLADVVVQTAGGGSGEAEARIGSIPLAHAEQLRADLLHWREREIPGPAGATAHPEDPAAAQPPDMTSSAGTAPVGADPIGRMSDLRGVFGQAERAARVSDFEYRLPFGRLLAAGLTSNAVLIAIAAGVGVVAQFAELFSGVARDATDALTRLALPALIAVGFAGLLLVVAASIAVVVARDFGFTARRVGDRLETEAGLTERRMTSLPVRRIQALRIEQTALRRLLGFASVHADTAGFGRSEEQKSTTAAALIPLARKAEVLPLMHRLLPEAETLPPTAGLPRRALRFYVLWPTVLAVLVTWVVIAAAALIVASAGDISWLEQVGVAAGAGAALVVGGFVAATQWQSWRSAAFGADERALAIRWGILGSYAVRLSRSRMQSLALRQTPFQRRAGLATIVVASVSGSAATHYRIRNLDVADARRLAEWYSPSPVEPAERASRVTPVTDT